MKPVTPGLLGPDFFNAVRARTPHRVLVGFDGFVDSLYRVIRDHAGGTKNPYLDIPDFAREVLDRAGKSGGFELALLEVRAGGNAPLMAGGLRALGVATTCVGTLGAPGIAPAFEPLREAGCALYSAAPAALTTALEFDDGKLMLNDSRAFEGLDWRSLSKALGAAGLAALADPCDLVALLGWANMPCATDLWRGFLETVLEPRGAGARGQGGKFFVDLADISRSGEAELRALFALLRRYRSHGTVALGLNENEALKLAGFLGLGVSEASGDLAGLAELAGKLHGELGLDLLVVHLRQGACVADGTGAWAVPGRLVEKPRLSTGAGDHFNAAFCFGWLHGLAPAGAARLAALSAGVYVERGVSPGLGDVEAQCIGLGEEHED